MLYEVITTLGADARGLQGLAHDRLRELRDVRDASANRTAQLGVEHVVDFVGAVCSYNFV